MTNITITEEDLMDMFLHPSYSINILHHLELADWGVGNYFMNSNVLIFTSDGESDRTNHIPVGCLKILHLHLGQSKLHKISVTEFLSANLPFGFNGIFTEEILALHPDFLENLETIPQNPDVMIISSFEILPLFRNLGVAECVVKLLLHHFKNSCGLLMMNCTPLQYTPEQINNERLYPEEVAPMQYEKFTPDFELAQLKLMKYFTEMGFKVYPKNPTILYIETATVKVSPKDFHIV